MKGYFPRLTTIAKWRNGKKYNVSIYLDTNTFYDFVSGDFGNVLSLHSFITGEDINSIDYGSFIKTYSNIEINTTIEKLIKECDYSEEENSSIETIEEIKYINSNSKEIFNNHYFKPKQIKHGNFDIKQIKISKYIMSLLDKKHIRLNNSDLHLLKLKNSIVIPMYNIKTKEMQSLQYILPLKENETNKLFHFGGKLKFSIYPININIENIENNTTFLLCEGVATGFSIHDIIKNIGIDIPIICCFNSKNIENVTDFLLENNKKVIIAADFDQPNIMKNQKIILGAGLNVIKKYNNNENVICSIANSFKNNSKYYLNSIYNNFLSENNDYCNNITDFNDIIVSENLSFATEIFKSNLNYYCKIFNKNNFFTKENKFDVYNNLINSPFSYKYTNKFNELNDIILENNFIFYDK